MTATIMIVGFIAAMLAISVMQNSPGLFVGSLVGMMFGGLVSAYERGAQS